MSSTVLKNRWLFAAALFLSLSRAVPAVAQDADELAKQTQNPVAGLISVPLQGNWDFGLGDRDATGTLLNIQPVMPFGVSKGMNVILRVIMPMMSQPGAGDVRINGLGDVVATAFFSPAALYPLTRQKNGGGSLWKTRRVRFPRSGGRVLCVHGSGSFHGPDAWS